MDVEALFYEEMKEIYRRAKDECGYNAAYLLRMIGEHGGVETARRLIAKPTDGFERLYSLNRLDLTVEVAVLKPEFKDLFAEEELEVCRRRLQKLNYPVD